MHYTPLLLPGAGLITLAFAVPPVGLAGLVAHIALVMAGLVFLALAAVFFTANIIGALHCRLHPAAVAAAVLPTLPREGAPW